MAQSLQQQLNQLLKNNKKVLKLKMDTGETIEELLKEEAKLLIKILKEEIDTFIYSHPEGWYERSEDLKNSIDENISVDLKTNSITIGFLKDKAWHDSWITKTYNPNYSKQAYVPQAIREGYEIFNTGHIVKGYDFIQKAIDKYNLVKRKGISVKIDDDGAIGNWWK